jgi:hypothetical protein
MYAIKALAIHLNRNIVVLKGGRKGNDKQKNLTIYPKSNDAVLARSFHIWTCDDKMCLPNICFEVDTIVIMHNSGAASLTFCGSHFWKTNLIDSRDNQSAEEFLATKKRECETSGIDIINGIVY